MPPKNNPKNYKAPKRTSEGPPSSDAPSTDAKSRTESRKSAAAASSNSEDKHSILQSDFQTLLHRISSTELRDEKTPPPGRILKSIENLQATAEKELAAKAKLADKTTVLGVAGPTKSGKSSWLNGLMGHPILRTALISETFIPASICFTEDAEICTIEFSCWTRIVGWCRKMFKQLFPRGLRAADLPSEDQTTDAQKFGQLFLRVQEKKHDNTQRWVFNRTDDQWWTEARSRLEIIGRLTRSFVLLTVKPTADEPFAKLQEKIKAEDIVETVVQSIIRITLPKKLAPFGDNNKVEFRDLPGVGEVGMLGRFVDRIVRHQAKDLDAALCLCAPDAAKQHSRKNIKLLKLLARAGDRIPAVVVVTKCDSMTEDYLEALGQVKAAFGSGEDDGSSTDDDGSSTDEPNDNDAETPSSDGDSDEEDEAASGDNDDDDEQQTADGSESDKDSDEEDSSSLHETPWLMSVQHCSAHNLLKAAAAERLLSGGGYPPDGGVVPDRRWWDSLSQGQQRDWSMVLNPALGGEIPQNKPQQQDSDDDDDGAPGAPQESLPSIFDHIPSQFELQAAVESGRKSNKDLFDCLRADADRFRFWRFAITAFSTCDANVQFLRAVLTEQKGADWAKEGPRKIEKLEAMLNDVDGSLGIEKMISKVARAVKKKVGSCCDEVSEALTEERKSLAPRGPLRKLVGDALKTAKEIRGKWRWSAPSLTEDRLPTILGNFEAELNELIKATLEEELTKQLTKRLKTEVAKFVFSGASSGDAASSAVMRALVTATVATAVAVAIGPAIVALVAAGYAIVKGVKALVKTIGATLSSPDTHAANFLSALADKVEGKGTDLSKRVEQDAGIKRQVAQVGEQTLRDVLSSLKLATAMRIERCQQLLRNGRELSLHILAFCVASLKTVPPEANGLLAIGDHDDKDENNNDDDDDSGGANWLLELCRAELADPKVTSVSFRRLAAALLSVTEGGEPALTKSNEKHVLLLIEGGGVKGILPLRAVKKLESGSYVGRPVSQWCDDKEKGAKQEKGKLEKGTKQKKKGKLEKETKQRLVVGGTSVGALIALALVTPRTDGRAPFTAAELFTEMRDLIPKMFNGNLIWMVLEGKEGRHDRAALEDFLRSNYDGLTLKDCRAHDVIIASLNCGTNDGGSAARPVIVSKQKNPNLPIFQAALMTSAAPTYFAPVTITKAEAKRYGIPAGNYIDGGVHENSVAMHALLLYGTEGSTAISLGTGRFASDRHKMADSAGIELLGRWGMPNAVFSLASDAQAARDEERCRLAAERQGVAFYLLQPSLPWSVELDDAGKQHALIQLAEAYVTSDYVKKRLAEAAARV